MDSNRIKELQEETAYPQSISVYKALLQVWNECQQEHNKQLRLHIVSQQRELLKAFTEKCNRYRTTMEEITPEEIDKFMDSL